MKMVLLFGITYINNVRLILKCKRLLRETLLLDRNIKSNYLIKNLQFKLFTVRLLNQPIRQKNIVLTLTKVKLAAKTIAKR